MLKRTPLYDIYRDYEGIKLIDFGGWELPVNFKAGIIAEHMVVRKNAGLFDVSHMGEIIIEGKGSEDYVDWLVTNDVKAMHINQVIYTLMCYPHGGVVDDLLVYKYSEEKYFLVVNASNVDKDFKWIKEENPKAKEYNQKLKIENISNEIAQLAFQGPNAEKYLQKITTYDLSSIKFFHFADNVEITGVKALISRTGYTGEDGFEIYLKNEDAGIIWTKILEAFKENGVLPCGLGARDTLRFEAKLPLYGQEIDKDITPLEANLKFFVKLEKEDFCGKQALVEQQEKGIPRTLRGCEMVDKGVPRHGNKVFKDGQEIGYVTTGAKSPMLNKFVALILIKRGIAKTGDIIEIEIHGKKKKAKIVKTPFYKNLPKKN